MPERSVPVLRRRTTWAAAGVLAASAVAASLVGHGTSGAAAGGGVAATVGRTTISDDAVAREAAVIEAQPEYAAALTGASTLALAAPLDPQAIIAAAADPDDLRVTAAAPAPTSSAAPSTRTYTDADLRAAVLDRLVYVAALRQVMAARHVTPSPRQQALGRELARVDSGVDAKGQSLFDRLPQWYQDELAGRGADAVALQQSITGQRGLDPSTVEASYAARAPEDYTIVCLRALTVPSASGAAAAQARLAAGDTTGATDAGCGVQVGWAPDVAAAVQLLPVGGVTAPLRRGDRVVLVQVERRTVEPLTAVEGSVLAGLSARQGDLVSTLVEAQLGLDRVRVAARYGTWQSAGPMAGIVPPDALTPPAPATSGSPTPRSTTPAPQPLDPLE